MAKSEENGTLPEQVGPYRLVRQLGSGSMATVSLAEQAGPSGFRKSVALKIIKPEYAGDETFIKMLMREAAIGGLLRHPNIVQTLSFEQYDGAYVLVLEYVRGKTVEELLADVTGGLEPSKALDIAVQTCRALAYAHSLCDDDGNPLVIVHRDLKPANLMLSRHDVVKIMDFGIARATASWAALTAQGIVRGTPSYMSPEQVLGKQLDGRSDLFSLGTIVFEMLTGEVLFTAPSMLKVMERVARVEVRDAFERCDTILPGSGAVLQRVLAPHPGDRYEDADGLGAALKLLLLGSADGSGQVAGARTATRLAALDDLSSVTDISGLTGGRPSTEARRLREQLRKSRPKKPPAKPAPPPDDDAPVEEFIYNEEEEEEEFFVWEEVDENASKPAAEPAPEPVAAKPAEPEPEPAAAAEGGEKWAGTLENDFFATGPQREMSEEDLGPGGAPDDTLFGQPDQAPSDAVARDVADPEQSLSTPTAADDDLFGEDDELWGEDVPVAATAELRALLEEELASAGPDQIGGANDDWMSDGDFEGDSTDDGPGLNGLVSSTLELDPSDTLRKIAAEDDDDEAGQTALDGELEAAQEPELSTHEGKALQDDEFELELDDDEPPTHEGALLRDDDLADDAGEHSE